MKNHRFASVFLLFALVFTLLAPPAHAVEKIDIAAKAALLVDAGSGEVLYEKNIHQELYPASITKVMTALLTLEAIDAGKLKMTDAITISASAMADLDADGSSAGLKVGEVLTVEQLLYCMLVVSANEACHILAEAVAGDVSTFVGMMNEKAQALGCENTHFTNTSGLPDPDHYTSAWDIYLMATEAMKHENFMTICNTASYTVPATNLSEERVLHTTNYLIDNWRARGYRYSGAQGIKTGSTDEAGHCLVSSAVRGERRLISVVLGADKITRDDNTTQVQSFSETARLFDWGFDNFEMTTLLAGDELICEVPVALSKDANYVVVHPERSVSAMMEKGIAADEITRTVKLYNETVNAPVAEGDVLGELELSHDGTVYATVPLLAANAVAASKLLTLEHTILSFFEKTIVRIALGAVAALVVGLIIWKNFFDRNRRYGRRTHTHSGYRGRRR